VREKKENPIREKKSEKRPRETRKERECLTELRQEATMCVRKGSQGKKEENRRQRKEKNAGGKD